MYYYHFFGNTFDGVDILSNNKHEKRYRVVFFSTAKTIFRLSQRLALENL